MEGMGKELEMPKWTWTLWRKVNCVGKDSLTPPAGGPLGSVTEAAPCKIMNFRVRAD